MAAAQQAIALIDVNPWNHMILGIVYLWQKHYEPAIAEMERTVVLAPTEAESYAILAETLSRVGRLDDALGMVGQALRQKPQVADNHLELVCKPGMLVNCRDDNPAESPR